MRNHQIINEEPEVNPTDQKLMQMETQIIWGSNTLKNKKIKKENIKRIQDYKNQNINKIAEDKKKIILIKMFQKQNQKKVAQKWINQKE